MSRGTCKHCKRFPDCRTHAGTRALFTNVRLFKRKIAIDEVPAMTGFSPIRLAKIAGHDRRLR